MKLVNRTRNNVLVERLEIADLPWTRMKGLLGRKELPDGHGLLIIPCNNIHMFFMRFPIDVVWLDRQNEIVKIVPSLGIWRLSWSPGAHSVVELPAGRLRRAPAQVGDQLEVVA